MEECRSHLWQALPTGKGVQGASVTMCSVGQELRPRPEPLCLALELSDQSQASESTLTVWNRPLCLLCRAVGELGLAKQYKDGLESSLSAALTAHAS